MMLVLLLSTYDVGAEQALSPMKMQLLNRGRKLFQHNNHDIHCCCVLCAFLDKVYVCVYSFNMVRKRTSWCKGSPPPPPNEVKKAMDIRDHNLGESMILGHKSPLHTRVHLLRTRHEQLVVISISSTCHEQSYI